ncbi:MAG TPA: signal peptidase I, partial [Sphingomicrobium sp.]|nr:signal peptidase I [Sphingomicrobium sp.]
MRWPLNRRAPAKGADEKQKDGGTGGLLRFLLLLAFFAWALRSFVVAPFSIPSGSMLPTLYIGDYLMVAKWPYGYSRYSFPFGFPSFEGRLLAQLPKRGDVVVFRHPSENIDLIKRVIA